MEKILVSACLLGDKTRYDGGSNLFPFLEELGKKYELVPFCPEIEAGLSVPRSPAEIVRNEVINKDGVNLTKVYNDAANKAYQICLFLGIKIAILKDGSPACGSRKIHNGKFDGGKIDGLGVTARYLISKNIKVYCENDNLEFLLAEKKERKRPSPIKKEESRYSAKAISKEETADKNNERKSHYGHKSSFSSSGHKSSFASKGKRDFSRKSKSPSSYQSGSHEHKNYGKSSSFEHKDRNDKPYYKKSSSSFSKNGEKKGSYPKRSFGEKKSFHKDGYKGKKSFSKNNYKDKRGDKSPTYKSKRPHSYKKEA